MYFAIVKKEGETSKESCKYIRKNKDLKVCKPYLE